MDELQTVSNDQLEDVSGGFAFLIPLIGAALGAVQGGMQSKNETGKIDWKQVASGALGGLGLGGSGGQQQQQAQPSQDGAGAAAAAAPSKK
jgi:hypothetical protein